MSPDAPKTTVVSTRRMIFEIACFVSIVLCVLLLIAGYFLYRLNKTLERSYFSMPPVEAACVMARLAPPPGELIRAESQVLFAGPAHFAFRADRDQIEAWIKSSNGTKSLAPVKTYSADFELRCLDIEQFNGEYDDNRYDVEPIYPDIEWFAPQIKNGVRYDVPPDEDYDRGSIFIDWDTNTVWVRAQHS